MTAPANPRTTRSGPSRLLRKWPGAVGAAILLAGCEGPQSALDTAGSDAATLSHLFYVMLAGAVVLWLAMNGLMLWAWRIKPRPVPPRYARRLIFVGGIVFPTVVLFALLTWGLSIMPDQRAPGEGLRVEVTGEQWWWRVHYWPEGATEPIRSANEIVLPVGTRSEITLKADRVIHSFWLPSIAGKTDMIPGRVNRMSMKPTEPGEFRGQCAEFCGDSHAWMAFTAKTMLPEDFDAWLAHEAGPAAPPEGELAEAGRKAFLAQGCGGCHAIRGTPARGRVGPNLTHLASRLSLAAGALPMTEEALVRWISNPEAVKPGVRMPSYDHLETETIRAMAAYLKGLE